MPPGPVSTSRTTVTATRTTLISGPATSITWHGEFDFADDEARLVVEHINRDIVWPALASALASALGVTATFDIAGGDPPNQRLRNVG